jgi:hypothetical protein
LGWRIRRLLSSRISISRWMTFNQISNENSSNSIF